MKLRYCFVLLLLVCFLCGNVYAEDLNSNNITSDFTFQKDNQVAEEISDDVLPGTDDVLGVEEDDRIGSQDNVIYVDANVLEDGDGSLDHPYNKLDMMRAFRIPSGSTIHLADGEYNFQYMMLNDVVIVGESQNAIVKNTIFGSSRSSMFGGGDASSLLIHNLTFVNSSFVYYDNFAAVGCVFKGYSSLGLIATSTNADIYEITGEYASATFDDCGFVDCGGESCVMSLGSGVLEIKNSYVESARNVLVHAERSTVVLNNVTVKRSNVGGLVDLIQLEGSRIYVIRSSFEENNVSGGSLIGMGDGVDVIIFKSNFTDNNIDNGVVNSNNALVNITNSIFINNHAKRFAGAVFAAQSSLLLENVSFERNSALWSGGAVVGLNTTVQILTCNFSDNSASYSEGALYAMYGDVIVSGSVFNSNRALNGGAIFLDYVSSLNLGSVLSYGNEFDGNGNYSVYAITDRDYDLGLPDVFQTKYPNIVIGDGDYSLVRFTQSFNGTIPVYYDLRQEGYVTPVKNQGPDGNCWAFACIAVLESCILKAMGTTYDFSEENMKNIMAWFSDYGWDCLPNQGGYTVMSLAYLTSWLGPVYEDDDPYSQSGSISEVLHSPFHVQNILFLDYDDFDSIKKAIIEYGAVGVSMLWDEDYINNDAYYCWNGSFSNHEVAIVGWNDTYSRNNFAAGHVPEGDGAWIIKNSWGEDVGDNGYFYISYYDKAFAVDDTIFTFIFNDTVRFDKNYQYDFGGDVVERTYGQKTVWYKNVFNATGNEALAAVSTYFLGDSDYVISVYVNGQMMLAQSGVSKKGYYTINLNRNISLSEGDIFEVQFKISVDDGKAFIPIADDSYLSRPLLGNGVSFFSNDGVNWVDLCSSANSKVACIKAFTVNEFKSKIDLSVVESQITAVVTDQYGNVLDGSVEFKVNNQSQHVEITDGKAILDWDFSYYDSYNITASWNKAGYVQSTSNMFYETPWDVTLNVNDVAYLEDVVISITLGEGKLLKNNITLRVGDYHYSLNQSNLMFTVPDTLNANHWNVSVSYVTGNGYEKSLNKSFNVNKKHINILLVNDIYRETGSVRYNSTTSENRLHVSTHDSIVKLNPWQPAPFFMKELMACHFI